MSLLLFALGVLHSRYVHPYGTLIVSMDSCLICVVALSFLISPSRDASSSQCGLLRQSRAALFGPALIQLHNG